VLWVASKQEAREGDVERRRCEHDLVLVLHEGGAVRFERLLPLLVLIISDPFDPLLGSASQGAKLRQCSDIFALPHH